MAAAVEEQQGGGAAAPDAPRLVLDRTPPLSLAAPPLDEQQRSVLAHGAGPLLVLAGPGTGKTPTLVEAMVARLQGPDAVRPDEVLGLTFGRRAAIEWRERVTARLGGGVIPTVTTFHSFAYALVRQAADPEAFAEPLRLLSGPEQEQRLRELLTGAVADGRLAWPQDLSAALGTRGLAAEVRAVVARARALGLDPWDLEAAAAQAGPLGPAWHAVSEFLGEYLDVLDAEGVTAYTEVVHRAALLVHDPEVQARLRAQYRVVLVDEFQDTDPAQVRLLEGLVGPGTSFVVVGDPDQSIYAFRGADIGGILGFRDRWRAPDGGPAPVVVLQRTRRFGPVLREAAGRVLRSTSLAPLPASVVKAHRSPECESPAYGDGVLDVVTFDSEQAEAAHVADLLRREHLERGVQWSDMAVLVRSGRRTIPPLRRALLAAGVPVEVAADEVPLRDEPALVPLLSALRVADLLKPDKRTGEVDPEAVDDATAHGLLLSPLGAADARRLGAVLRDVHGVRTAPAPGLAAYRAGRVRDAEAALAGTPDAGLARRVAGSPPAPDGALALLHGDLVAANVLWTASGGPVLIDWEFHRMGDPAEDLAYLAELNGLPDPVLAAILDGYAEPAVAARVEGWRGLAAADAGGWYLAHGMPDEAERMLARARGRAARG